MLIALEGLLIILQAFNSNTIFTWDAYIDGIVPKPDAAEALIGSAVAPLRKIELVPKGEWSMYMEVRSSHTFILAVFGCRRTHCGFVSRFDE